MVNVANAKDSACRTVVSNTAAGNLAWHTEVHANTSNMSKCDYNHTRDQMRDTNSKAMQ